MCCLSRGCGGIGVVVLLAPDSGGVCGVIGTHKVKAGGVYNLRYFTSTRE